jgi:hypothetical protein
MWTLNLSQVLMPIYWYFIFDYGSVGWVPSSLDLILQQRTSYVRAPLGTQPVRRILSELCVLGILPWCDQLWEAAKRLRKSRAQALQISSYDAVARLAVWLSRWRYLEPPTTVVYVFSREIWDHFVFFKWSGITLFRLISPSMDPTTYWALDLCLDRRRPAC